MENKHCHDAHLEPPPAVEQWHYQLEIPVVFMTCSCASWRKINGCYEEQNDGLNQWSGILTTEHSFQSLCIHSKIWAGFKCVHVCVSVCMHVYNSADRTELPYFLFLVASPFSSITLEPAGRWHRRLQRKGKLAKITSHLFILFLFFTTGSVCHKTPFECCHGILKPKVLNPYNEVENPIMPDAGPCKWFLLHTL